MIKHFNMIGFKTMPFLCVVLVFLNFTLMMLNIFIGSWFMVGINVIGLVASHIGFNHAFDTEKAFDDFLNGKVN